jgi:integrase
MMEQNGGLRWDDDVRQIGRTILGAGNAEGVVTRWEKKVLAASPPGTLLRWMRQVSGKHGIKGELILEQGRPQCEGLTVVVSGSPHFQRKADGSKRRVYPRYQRRALNDGTQITTIGMAWTAFAELKAQTAALQATAIRLVGKPPAGASGLANSVPTNVSSGLLTAQQAALRTRGGASLGGVATRHFSAEEKTYGALIARMVAKPGKTTVGTIENNRHIARRVLANGTRLDLLQREDYQTIYDEIGSLANLHRPTRINEAGIPEARLIGNGTRANMWTAFLRALDYARREGWLKHEARDIDLERAGQSKDVVKLSRRETRQLELFALGLSRRAHLAVESGAVAHVTARAGRIYTHSAHWPRIMNTAMASDDLVAMTDLRVASVGSIPIIQLAVNVRYFATGIAAYVLIASGLGPRPGELDALCWDSVDLEAGTIVWERRILNRLQQTPGEPRRWTALGCKGTRGDEIVRRTVHMTEEVCLALRAWRRERPAVMLAMGWQPQLQKAGGLVFPSIGGSFMDQSRSRLIWQAIEQAAGVPTTRPHSVRHTIATEGALTGVPSIVRSGVLGHGVRMDDDIYARIEAERGAAEFTSGEERWRREYDETARFVVPAEVDEEPSDELTSETG